MTVRVVNHGLLGVSAFHEFLVLEQGLARRDPPDPPVFSHGFNDRSTQTEAPQNFSEQPTVFPLRVTADAAPDKAGLPVCLSSAPAHGGDIRTLPASATYC